MSDLAMREEADSKRKYYLDNIRFLTVLLVIAYHVVYVFNSVGVITNIDVPGIPQMDVLMYFVYPWFMNLLFVVAGMSARYSLEKRNDRAFLKERTKRLLVPSVAGIFLLGWVSGWVTNQYADMFAENGAQIPGFVKYLIYCLCGIGPLWFAHELFLASLVLLLLRKLEWQEKIWKLGAKTPVWFLLLLVFAVWGSSKIGNTPLVVVYRNGIYIFMFLLGYYVFSHEEVLKRLEQYRIVLLAAAIVAGVAYTVYYYGENYTTSECLQNFFTNAYAWLAILAVLACFHAWGEWKNPFSVYMTKRSFGFYVLHYPLLIMLAYLITTYLNLPVLCNYLLLLLLEILLLPFFYEVVSRLPVIRYLLLGITGKKRKAEA